MKRKIITLLIGALAVFAFMPVSSALATTYLGGSGDCGRVLDTPGETYILNDDIICPAGGCASGLIIGAADITIDGDCHKLVGNVNKQLCCPVLMNGDEPAGQPCRLAAFGGGTGLCSGIFNASPVTGQSGFDGLTVKNLEITGWCDGIFTSGTIGSSPSNPATHDLVEGQVFFHNVIHHNGEDCETCFNDGIFTALLGVADSSYPNLTPINNPGTYSCTEENTSVISNNNIWSQKGWGIEAGPGGNGINLQGGVEFGIGPTNPIRYSSCVEVHNNAIMKVRLSGIMLTHALEGVNIYKNDIEYAEYGGITIPCDFVKYNTIEHNVIIKCAGVGIGVFEGTHIIGNVVKDTVKGLAHFDYLGFPNDGDGILIGNVGKVGNSSDVNDNISCFSFAKDIKALNPSTITCEDCGNQCCKTNPPAKKCHRWNCPCFPADPDEYDCNDPGYGADGWSDWKKAISGDVNNSRSVTADDRAVLYDVWLKSFTNQW